MEKVLCSILQVIDILESGLITFSMVLEVYTLVGELLKVIGKWASSKAINTKIRI